MRILVVTPWFPTAASPGAGIFNLRDVQLIAKNHDVTVVHLSSDRNAEDLFLEDRAGTRQFRLERIFFSLSKPASLMRSRAYLKRRAREFDLVHTMAMPALIPTALARLDRPWVHTEHYSQLVTPGRPLRTRASLAILKRLFRKPDELISVSRSLADVMDAYRRSRTLTTVVANEVMRPSKAVVNDRTVPGSPLRIIGVGGLIARKGPIEALDTLVELRRRGVDAHLTWVGEGDLRARLTETAEQAGVSEFFELTGHLAPEQLSERLLQATVFLLPVETETFGVAIAEAMTHGLPVIATGSGGHLEFLDERSATLVNEREAIALADAVEELTLRINLPTRTEIARHAESLFSSEVREKSYEAVYQRAVSSFGSKK